ncbi:hypothetical protein C7S15_5690 [Burkholderia cepacia]|nr:hypothetical protein [Burkholderia cepacia]
MGCYAARRDPDGFDAADREYSGQARRSIDARVRIATSCRFVHRARTDFLRSFSCLFGPSSSISI